MSLREKMNNNPAVSGTIAVVLVLGAVALIWYSMKPATNSVPTKAYYTTDDGQTWFADAIDKATPFDHGGKEAVKAYVYTCDNGKTKFVAYLEKGGQPAPQADQAAAEPAATPKTEAEARAMAAKQPRKPAFGQFTAQVKKPGDAKWLTSGDPKYFPTINPQCQNASVAPDRVFP